MGKKFTIFLMVSGIVSAVMAAESDTEKKQKEQNKTAKTWAHLLKDQVDKACERKADLQRSIEKLNREHEQKVQALIRKSRNPGLSQKEISDMIFAHRQNANLKIDSHIKKAAYGEIVAQENNKTKEKILVIGADGKPGTVWQGVIYPAGIKTDLDDCKAVPVFCTDFNRAVSLLQHHLNRYADNIVDRPRANIEQGSALERLENENRDEIRRAEERARNEEIRKERKEAQESAKKEAAEKQRDKQKAEQAEENVLQSENNALYNNNQEEYQPEQDDSGMNYWYGGNTYIYPSTWYHRRYPYHPYHPYHPRPTPRVYGGNNFRGGSFQGGGFHGGGRR